MEESLRTASREWRAKVTKNRKKKQANAITQIILANDAIQAGVLFDDPLKQKQYFQEAAEARREIFMRKDSLLHYGPDLIAAPAVIQGIFAAMAAGDSKVAKDIAQVQPPEKERRYADRQSRLFASALRSLVLETNFSSFTKVTGKRWGYPELAKIFLLIPRDKDEAIAALERFGHWRSRYYTFRRGAGNEVLHLAMFALREFIKTFK